MQKLRPKLDKWQRLITENECLLRQEREKEVLFRLKQKELDKDLFHARIAAYNYKRFFELPNHLGILT